MMNYIKYKNGITSPFLWCITFLQILTFSISAQNKPTTDSIISSFEAYSKLPREVAYVHLNKSTYIKGEIIGFSAYILDKETKNPSALTTNLYCTITDQQNKIVKSKLIKVKNGLAHGIFNVDSLFTSSEYTFKAYTNWMKNFDEQNLFAETIKIIDPDIDAVIKPKTLQHTIDAQFLAEGGHLVANVQNTLGVIIKDAEGFGIPFTEGEITDSNNNFITNFKTNKLGIGRFLLTPIFNENYTITINHLGKSFTFHIDNIELKGISISVNDLGKKVALNFKTNEKTLPSLKNKTFKLAIHNGETIKVTDVSFEGLEILKLISYTDLSPGINIFTLFDHNNKPILERLFFKYEGINLLKTGAFTLNKKNDSTQINLPIHQWNSSIENNISISILPENTKSYQSHHNIISYAFLQAYVKGYVENAAYYFTNIDRKKTYELDNLLITQGWSSYSWNAIFNNPPTNNYVFENGIGFKANINNLKSNQFLLFALNENKGDLFVLAEGEKSFQKAGLYPIEDEIIRIGEINKKGKMDGSNLYLQFSPSKIPAYNYNYSILKPKVPVHTATIQIQPFTQSVLDQTQQLDEVLIEAKKELTKTERLQKRTRGNVEVFDDSKRLHNPSLSNYLSKKGFVADDHQGILTISIRNPLTPNNTTPIVYLDDVLLSDFSYLANFDMGTVDYIEINKTGLGEGLRGGAGVIKIYTDPNVLFTRKYGETYKAYAVPLTFSKTKTFYTPKYTYYKSQFFKEYGVIGWIPNSKIDAHGNLNFSVNNTGSNNLKLYIEGITSDGRFIAEEKIITIN